MDSLLRGRGSLTLALGLLTVLWKTGCGGGAVEMPQSAALPRLHTRRGNNEIRIRNLGNLYCPDAIVMKLDIGIYEIQTSLTLL